ncbi:MAG: DUF1330 domain-containing protein [Alphaproteobacteria bacterium]|nr:DUF1330 domain-containing protein [Alphaproteobacteria bacterium]
MLIDPTQEQLEKLSTLDQREPVIFINLMRFHEMARYTGEEGSVDRPYTREVSGREAYQRYLSLIEETFMARVGGRVFLAGPVAAVVVGEAEWDDVVVAEFPTIGDALRMPRLDGYDDAAVHRTAGVREAETIVLVQDAMQRMAIPGAWITRV